MKLLTMFDFAFTATGVKQMPLVNADSANEQPIEMQNLPIKEWLREIRIENLERTNKYEQ